ncbi:MAG: Clp protease ClpP [Rikenellaceae bacterium]
MKQEIKIYNVHDTAVIDIEGTIGIPEEWQFDEPQQRVATYEKFRKSLQTIEELKSEKVIVNIRSTGGDVNDALLIYDALSTLNAYITTRCWGYVASAATVIAQAASEGQREISPNSLYLIHSASCAVEGNSSELALRMELLLKTDERLAELYARRSGRDIELYSSLMAEDNGAGRWLNASEVIDLSLADCLIESNVAEADLEVEEQPSEKSILEGALESVKDVVRRVGRRIGVTVVDTPNDVEVIASKSIVSRHSVTHQNAVDATEQRSLIAFDEGQRELSRSEVREVEDPNIGDIRRSSNATAYDLDIRRMLS